MAIDLSEVKFYFNEEHFNWNDITIEFESSFITIHDVPIWKAKKSTYQIFTLEGFEHINTKEDAISFIKDNFDRIEGVIEWVECSRVDIGKFLIRKGAKDTAEDWMNVGLSDEEFIESLHICDIVIDYNESPELDKLHLEIMFDPDYFEGHLAHIEVDEYMELTYRGL